MRNKDSREETSGYWGWKIPLIPRPTPGLPCWVLTVICFSWDLRTPTVLSLPLEFVALWLIPPVWAHFVCLVLTLPELVEIHGSALRSCTCPLRSCSRAWVSLLALQYLHSLLKGFSRPITLWAWLTAGLWEWPAAFGMGFMDPACSGLTSRGHFRPLLFCERTGHTWEICFGFS